jgi:hypothetical protein
VVTFAGHFLDALSQTRRGAGDRLFTEHDGSVCVVVDLF